MRTCRREGFEFRLWCVVCWSPHLWVPLSLLEKRWFHGEVAWWDLPEAIYRGWALRSEDGKIKGVCLTFFYRSEFLFLTCLWTWRVGSMLGNWSCLHVRPIAVFLTRELSEVDLRVHVMSAMASVMQCLERLGMLS